MITQPKNISLKTFAEQQCRNNSLGSSAGSFLLKLPTAERN